MKLIERHFDTVDESEIESQAVFDTFKERRRSGGVKVVLPLPKRIVTKNTVAKFK